MHCIPCMHCLICVSLGDVWGTVCQHNSRGSPREELFRSNVAALRNTLGGFHLPEKIATVKTQRNCDRSREQSDSLRWIDLDLRLFLSSEVKERGRLRLLRFLCEISLI